jgi:hypothetical protein
MRAIRWLILGAAAVKLCAAQGGIRFESSDGVYRCYCSGFGSGRQELDEHKVRVARPLCESAYNGFIFASFIPGAYYECTIQA